MSGDHLDSEPLFGTTPQVVRFEKCSALLFTHTQESGHLSQPCSVSSAVKRGDATLDLALRLHFQQHTSSSIVHQPQYCEFERDLFSSFSLISPQLRVQNTRSREPIVAFPLVSFYNKQQHGPHGRCWRRTYVNRVLRQETQRVWQNAFATHAASHTLPLQNHCTSH